MRHRLFFRFAFYLFASSHELSWTAERQHIFGTSNRLTSSIMNLNFNSSPLFAIEYVTLNYRC